MSGVEVLVAIAILVGLAGIIVPILPGAVLIGAAILAWAFHVDTRTGWVVLAVSLAWLLAGAVLKYVVPGRRLSEAGVPSRTLWAGAALGIVGFFVIPVIGLFVGFVVGVYAAERARLGAESAGASTRAALKAAGVSILIELVSGTAAAATWAAGVVVT
ncbi:DUF456 domain-containing protein [Nocardioides aestuarii]|uniref:DUF456 domain-containing protein n=1 Tax=Nocardioides aestuarii TaxID=252231 RepID=A0ABW4TH08_9ACTN